MVRNVMSSPPDLAAILGKISDGICVLTRDRQISFMNQKASEIFEAADELFEDEVWQALADRAVIRFEHFHASLNRWFEHHTYPNPDGGLTLISCDITSRRRMEEALRASEARFSRLINSNIIGVIVVENGYITEANDVFLRMIGYPRIALVERQLRWREMTPSEFDAVDEKARTELESKGLFSPYEKEFIRADGSRIPVLIGCVALQSAAKEHETLCLVLDLRERRRAEQRVQCIAEAGKILASSLDCAKTFPEFAEFVVSHLADACTIFILENEEKLRIADACSVPLTKEADFEYDVNRVLASGKGSLTSAPVSRLFVPLTARNQVAGVLTVAARNPNAFDIEDLHLFEVLGRRVGVALENAKLFNETQRANRLKDEFVAMISHELRTPLTPILGGVYMMRHDLNDAAVVGRALDIIERNAKTQVRIVDDLLDVSRALSGKLRLNIQNVDVGQIIQSAVETVRPASEAKGLQIEVRIGDLRGSVVGDPERLQQVVWNLVANSVKFTPASGRVRVELLESAGNAEIRVSDTGIGIAPDFLPHVFEKFRQADASRTRLAGGLGLGLAIVRHLVESHGGTVHAHSSGDEQGSTFVVRLPLRHNVRQASAENV